MGGEWSEKKGVGLVGGGGGDGERERFFLFRHVDIGSVLLVWNSL